jgi:hypothetical protein
MLFLVVGTPWNRPRSSRLCSPTAVMAGSAAYPPPEQQRYERLRNSCGSESSASSTTLTKCSRFILYPLKRISARSFRVTVVVFVVIIVIIFFAVAFVFFFFLWLLSKEYIGSDRPTKRV